MAVNGMEAAHSRRSPAAGFRSAYRWRDRRLQAPRLKSNKGDKLETVASFKVHDFSWEKWPGGEVASEHISHIMCESSVILPLIILFSFDFQWEASRVLNHRSP